MPEVSPRSSVELAELPTPASTAGNAGQTVRTAITEGPPNVGFIVVCRGRHGGNIPFLLDLPADVTGEEFMIRLREFIHSTVSTSRHVRRRPQMARLLLRETVGLGTVSTLVATPVPGHLGSHVWPVDLLLSETRNSHDFATGYRRPASLRHTLRFPEHAVFRTENHDRRVIVTGYEASPFRIALGFVVSIVLALVSFAIVVGVVGRWDIAAVTAAVIFAVLNLLQGLVFWMLKQLTSQHSL